MKYTVLVADDHPAFRKGVRALLDENSELGVVAEFSDGLQAYQGILAERPDLAILDIEMPGLTGLEICKKLITEKAKTKIILITMHRDKHFFTDAMKAGVMGYLLKDDVVHGLGKCVEAVLKGERFVSPGIKNGSSFAGQDALPELALLTATEKIILKLIAETKTSAEIAQLLFVSGDAVEIHRSNLVKKLGIEGKKSALEFVARYKHLL